MLTDSLPKPAGSLRVCLDTSVLISAFWLPKGTSGKVLDRIVRSKRAIRLVISPHLRDEFERNMYRLEFPLEEILSYSNFLLRLDAYVIPKRINNVVAHEPDNHILATAKLGKANYLVTRDKKHLLPLKSYGSTKIVSPYQFLQLSVA
ncbi:putative toxin-antitoxin system toxin component, PIN family [Candidatus Berkelbacteria bacterium]|nr:putative toxin-antitoxin system toxin component, PIN family [Candidatus Berkelbacteria bacterium]